MQEDFLPNPFPSLDSPGYLNPFSYKPTVVIFISSTHHALRDFCTDLCSHQPAQSTHQSGISKIAAKVSPPPSRLLLASVLPSGRTRCSQRPAASSLTSGPASGNVERNKGKTSAALPACAEMVLCSSFTREMFSELTGLQLLNCFK